MKLDNVLKQAVRFTKRNSTTILSIASGVGVVASMVLVAKETPLAIERIKNAEEVKEEALTPLESIIVATPAYIPSIVVGTSTLVCILSCSVLNARRQNQLVSLCHLANSSYREYREKLIELKGEELDTEIIAEVTRSRSDYHLTDSDDPDVKFTWYEPILGEYLTRYEREIIDAEYHLNRNYALYGCVTVNDWYEMLGLRQTMEGAVLGWTIEDGVYWIDFEHRLQEMSDGTKYYVIKPLFPPNEEIDEL